MRLKAKPTIEVVYHEGATSAACPICNAFVVRAEATPISSIFEDLAKLCSCGAGTAPTLSTADVCLHMASRFGG
jgi:hypothetical protein